MITFNILISIFCFLLSYVIYTIYIRKILADKEKFKLYALRDQLNIMAMSQIINYKSEEYQFVIRQINLGIRLYDVDISITNTISSCVAESEPANVRLFKKVLKMAKENKEFNDILCEYYFLLNRKLKKELKLAYSLMKLIRAVFQSFCCLINILTRKPAHFASYYAIEKQIDGIDKYKKKVLQPAISKLKLQNA